MYWQPIKLSVDYMPSDQYAVCSKPPVFSWGIEATDKNICQSAYRIKAFDDEKILWDSGWVKTANTTALYEGEPLKPGMRVTWQLQLENRPGEKSKIVEGRFRVVPKILEGVKWITQKDNEESSVIYFAKKFQCDRAIKRATLYVSGLGYHVVSINGKKADDAVLQPMISNYAKKCFFVTLSVEELLQLGENTIGIRVGDGWRRNPGPYLDALNGRTVDLFGIPQLAARLDIEYKDHTIKTVSTDDTWFALTGGTVKSHLFDGEVFDASKEPNGWDASAFDFSGCEKAVYAQDVGALIPQFAEPIKIQKSIKPIAKTMVEDGVYIFDFGENIAGYAEIIIPAGMKKGDTISLRFSEETGLDGTLCMDTMRCALSHDKYISDGQDEGNIWSPGFLYHGFRYVEVKGWGGIPDLNSITAIVVYSDVDNQSFFRCGSAIVNQIQENVVRTERDNLHGIATDCPQRDERMGWMNDATVRFEEIAYNFNVSRLFPKIIGDIVAEQDESGAITCTAPYIYGCQPADPVCSSFLIAGWQTWLHYGNKEILANNYSHFKAWNECLKKNSDDGIVNFSYYGDWAGTVDSCVSQEIPFSTVTPGLLMSTGYHYLNYVLLAKMANILGNKKEKEENEKEAERVRQAFLAQWWNEETGIVATGSQGCQAFALWLGILPEDGRKKAAENLHKAVAEIGYRLKAGNLTSRYIMDMLAHYGYIDDAWKIITREEYPSFGYMIQNGATTIWERFEQKKENGMNSHNHPMYGAVGSWFYSHIAGLIPLSNGWERFSIKPHIPTDLLYAEAHLDTMRGDVSIKWFKRYDELHIHINVPYGTTATYEYSEDKKTLTHGFYNFTYPI